MSIDATERLEELASVIAQVRAMVCDRRGPLDGGLTREIVARLRDLADDVSDPALCAAVRVGCAYLSAGSPERTHMALGVAADLLHPLPARPPGG